MGDKDNENPASDNKKTDVESKLPNVSSKDDTSSGSLHAKRNEEAVSLVKETNTLLEDNDTDDDDDNNDINVLPIDRGWAWVILAGATFEVFLYGGLMKSYGIFFVEFQKRFGSNASETNVMQTIHNIVVSISGVFVTNVGLKYISTRTAVFIGALGSCLAYLISAFATDIRVMSLTIGVIAGLSNTMMFLPIVATIGVYFKKHRGLANSIHVSGSCIGSLVFGPFYTAMFDYYGYTGTMMIVSALLFNSLITGALIRPIGFYNMKRKWTEMKQMKKEFNSKNVITNENGSNPVIQNSKENNSLNYTSGIVKKVDEFSEKQTKDQESEHGHLLRSVSEQNSSTEKRNFHKRFPNDVKPYLMNRTISYDVEHAKDAAFPSPMLARRLRANTHAGRNRTMSELSQSSVIGSVLDSISRSRVALYTSGDVTCETISMGQIHALDDADESVIISKNEIRTDAKADNKTCAKKVVHFFKTVFDMSVFSPIFVHYLLMAAFAISGSIMLSVYLIPYAKEVGATSGDISTIFIVLSGVDLVSRILSGFVADRKWLKPTTIVAIATAIIGSMCHVIRFFNEYWSLIVFAVIQGAFSGTYICLYNVIVIEHMGLDKFKSTLGFTAMCHGVSIAVFFQLTGILRDVSGNYYYTYHLIGTLLLLASALSLTLPLTSAYINKKSKKTSTP